MSAGYVIDSGPHGTEVVILAPDGTGGYTETFTEWTDDADAAARAVAGRVVVVNSEPARVLADYSGQAPRDLRVVVSRVQRDPYGADGAWMDGDARTLREFPDDVDGYDAWSVDDGSPVQWAAGVIARTDATEPSVDPIPDALPESAWMGGTYESPVDTSRTETAARLEGDWTPGERAEVFRAVVARWRS